MSCFLLFILSFHCIIKQTLAFKFSPLSFDQAYAPLFGDGNLIKSSDGKSVRLILDQRTGSGFISSDLYQYGFFSASIKLPSDYTAGVVVAFYTSNGDIFEKTHDELDFEFLGNIYGKEWKIQTNVYGNGSTSRGREERYLLWFDPSKEFHRYSILWTKKNIIFYIDDIPIREVIRNDDMGAEYPSKPMSLYATIWDGSTWATSGGKYKINYKYAPFVSEFTNFVIKGCRVDPIQQLPSTGNCTSMESELSKDNFAIISPERRDAMRKFRMKYMTYSYCYANLRYPTPLPECVLIPSERRRFKESGRVKSINNNNNNRRRRNKNRSRSGTNVSENQASM